MSQWKSDDGPNGSWSNGPSSSWNPVDTNGDSSAFQGNSRNSDWGNKGGPGSHNIQDQKKTNGWPAISSANGNGPKPMNGSSLGFDGTTQSSSGNSLLSTNFSQGQNIRGNDMGLTQSSIWGSGGPRNQFSPSGWGGLTSPVGGVTKSEASSYSSFNQGLQSGGGMQNNSGSSPSVWEQSQGNGPPQTEGSYPSRNSFTTSNSNNSTMGWSSSSDAAAKDDGQQKQQQQPSSNETPDKVQGSNSPGVNTTTALSPSVSPDTSSSTPTSSGAPPTSSQSHLNPTQAQGHGWQEPGGTWSSQLNQQGGPPSSGGSSWTSNTSSTFASKGWGDAPPTTSANGGWNAPQPTGWGEPSKPDVEASGTAIWGSKPSGPPPQSARSAWGKPDAVPDNKWGNMNAPSAPKGWGPLPTASGWGNTPKAPSAWGDANRQQPPNNGRQPGNNQGNIEGTGGWGKIPIDQGTRWAVSSAPDNTGTDTGTAVWSSQNAQQQPPQQMPNAWNKEPPKPSPWGNPNAPGHPQGESAWGQAHPSHNKPWGKPDEPKPAWGAPPPKPPSQWNQPPGNVNERGDGRSGGAWGGASAPTPSKPPSGFNSGDTQPNWGGTWPAKTEKDMGNRPAGSGWMASVDIPMQEIVPTGWGDLSPSVMNEKNFGSDDGTYVWGDFKEHNAWVTEMSAKNAVRMKQLAAKLANSTMQSPTTPTSKPPSSPNSDGTSTTPPTTTTATSSSWAEGEQKTGWDTSTAPLSAKSDGSGGASEWGRPYSRQSSESKWGETSSWGDSSTNPSTQKESMQNWNGENNPGSIGHWKDDDWEQGSQSSESSQGWNKKPNSKLQENKRDNLWKLQRLVERGVSKEDGETLLKKHNFDLDAAMEELTGISPRNNMNMKSSNDMDLLGNMTSDMSNLNIQGPGDIANANMPLSMMPGMPSKQMGPVGSGGLGFPGQQPQRMPQQPQKYMPGSVQMGGNTGQPMRGSFNPMQQQQQQQQQQILKQLISQMGNMNQNPQMNSQLLYFLQKNPQLLAQIQASAAGGTGNSQMLGSSQRPPQDVMRMAQQQMNMQQNHPGSRQSYPGRSSMPVDNDLTNADFLSGSGFGPDFGGSNAPQQSRMVEIFNKRHSMSKMPSKVPSSISRPVRSESDALRRDSASGTTSPAASENFPDSADSAFSESSWSFNPGSDLASDTVDSLPEFKPGVPWNPRTRDISKDPNATPGSVGFNPLLLPTGKTPGRERENRQQQQRDDLQGILIRPMKPGQNTNSPNPMWGNSGNKRQGSSWNYQDNRQQPWNASKGQRPAGPPPGFDSARGGGGGWGRGSSWDNSGVGGGGWSGNDGVMGQSTWLILKNVGNVDQNYLNYLCNQVAPVDHFSMNPSQGIAVVSFKSKDDANKVRQSLNNTPSLGISASFVSQAEIAPFLERTQWSNGQNRFAPGGWEDVSRNQWNSTGGMGGSSSGMVGMGDVGLPQLPGSQLWSPNPGGYMGWSGSSDINPSTNNLGLLPDNLFN